VRRLVDAAHVAGVQEVVLWDHALYDLDADATMRNYDAIARIGWPTQTHGVANAYGGLTFPMTER
jgi:hypothetical protein